ncbi:glycoside hydrolase family 15 protein [Actinomadura viridis]|uniref:glycoside hydrolase family 15 protein n=1 Tax=Actinomadura viridis TaxID=58110 RepID=UPI0036988D75
MAVDRIGSPEADVVSWGSAVPPRGHTLRKVRRTAALLLVAALVGTCGATFPDRGVPAGVSPGMVGGGGWPFTGVPIPADAAEGASYLPGSSVLLLRDGRVRLVPFGTSTAITVDASDPRVAAAVRSDNAWLAGGAVPDGGAAVPAATRRVYRGMAERALLDLRLLTRPNGASQASWYGAWRYSWPRDSAFTAVAFAMTGHDTEAQRVLRFLARVQHEDGLWAARYHTDGTEVVDGRDPQLDSLGWVLWASWLFRERSPASAAGMAELWPMVVRAADHLAGSLDVEGLPPPSSDYWERKPGSEEDPRRPTLGVVGPVLAGLRSASAFAHGIGRTDKAAHWQDAAGRLSDAVIRQFTPYGYPRSPIRNGLMDTSVTFVAPPFAPADPGVTAAVAEGFRRTSLPNGGVLPGERWSGSPDVAWTPEMALFALTSAASGRTEEALGRLDWLAEHRTSLGVLPEKVDAEGQPASVAPLGWTASLVLLTLAALERPLPIPPVR